MIPILGENLSLLHLNYWFNCLKLSNSPSKLFLTHENVEIFIFFFEY